MSREVALEWIVEQIDAVFDAYSKDVADAAMPVLILMLLRDFPAEELDPRIQREGEAILARAGVTATMTPDQAARRIDRWVAALPVHEELLRDLKRVFDVHQEALADETRAGFRKLIGQRSQPLAPRIGEARPANTERVPQHTIPRRM